MSLPVSSVRDMSDKRRARRAKQVRRDELRAKKRNGESSAEWNLREAIRRALPNHPMGLLSMASYVIHVAKPEPLVSLKSGRTDQNYLEGILTSFIGERNREMTALLAVIAELLVDDPAPQLRCRREVAERGERLPRWIAALTQVEVYRAVRRTNVFGDVDELVIGMRLDGGHELTVAVRIDHNLWSSVADAGVVPDPIDEALAPSGRIKQRHGRFRDDAGRCAGVDRGCARQADACTGDRNLAALPGAGSVVGRSAARRW